MVPTSTSAVVIFLLLVTPDIAFELLWQRTRPRRDESAFIEIGRVLLTGVVFSGSALAAVTAVAAFVPGAAIDLVALVRDGSDHVEREPALVLRSATAVLVLALLVAAAAHALLTPEAARRIADETAWHTAFARMAGPGVRAFLSVQLKDGTTITGNSAGYSTEPDPAKRDLLLSAPLGIRLPGADTQTKLPDPWQVMVIPGAAIGTIAAAYVGTSRPPSRPRHPRAPLGRPPPGALLPGRRAGRRGDPDRDRVGSPDRGARRPRVTPAARTEVRRDEPDHPVARAAVPPALDGLDDRRGAAPCPPDPLRRAHRRRALPRRAGRPPRRDP